MSKDVTLDDAVAALGQMANFFKAFRRVEELVQFMQSAEQRKSEQEAAIHRFDTLLSDLGKNHEAQAEQLKVELTEVSDKAKAAKARLAKVEAEEKKAIEAAARTAEALAEEAKARAQAIAEEQAEADAMLNATREAEAEAQVRLDDIRAKIAGIAAASAV